MSLLSALKSIFAKPGGEFSPVTICNLSDGAEDFDYFKDITFSITNVQRVRTEYVYECYGLYNGVTVGMKIGISRSIRAGIGPNGPLAKDGSVKDGVRFISLGQASDRLISVLSAVYEIDVKGKFAGNSVVDVISLNMDAVDLDRAASYRLKLFFNPDSEEHYAEAFLVINLIDNKISLNEKDTEYRENILLNLVQ